MEFPEEKKFSFIVPIHNVPKDTLIRCLKSIEDQDYPNIEVILVPNADPEGKELAQQFSKDKENWRVVSSDEPGACQARNLGFKHSTGDIVSFFNSDYIAKVGMVSSWMNTFEKSKADFLYGGYEWRSMNASPYPSKPFDQYSLEVGNFIDCGFPLKREFVVEWDKEVKSLQDWDFWLRVVKKGAKPHFLGREYSFLAEPPRPKGLSDDSHNNWVERVNFVKKKNGIPIRDMVVTSFGAQNHALNIAKMLNADYRDDTLFKPHEYKALYLIGFYMHPNQGDNPHAHALRFFENSKRIVHFVGADIYWLKSFPWNQLKGISVAINELSSVVLCENEQAQKELSDLGIKSEIVPIPPYTDLSLKPLPEDFSVALYLTDKSDFDKYCQKETLSIVKAMPDVQFVGYGDAGLEGFEAKNFRMVGNLSREEWEKFVYERSAYLRLAKHDTRPMASDEFLIAGRNVITNIPSDHVDYLNTGGDMPVNDWDRFSPGFQTLRWPDTKKEVIKKIRAIREKQRKPDNVFEAERLAKSIALKHELNKDTYREKIKSYVGELCQK